MSEENPYAPNLDVGAMQAQLAVNQASIGKTTYYGDAGAVMTQNRASWGDYGAMMASGARSVGDAAQGIYAGGAGMLATVGSILRPIPYQPPARVETGYYGQYQQQTGFARDMAATLGHGAPPGVSNYQHGYYGSVDMGNRVANLATSGIAVAAATMAGFKIGDPVGKAIGQSLGSVLGPGASRLLGGVGMLAGGIAAYEGVQYLTEMVTDRRAANAMLESGSFRFAGAGGAMADVHTGTGMGRAERKEFTTFMRGMEYKDTNLNFEDLSSILKEGMSQGAFTGAGGDMASFQKKFKELTEGVKVVTKTLHTTLKEGVKVMADLKAINIMPSSMSDVTFQASALGMVAGRTGMEMVGLGLQGAELFRGTGVEAKIGYQSNVMNMASIRSARDAGLLSQENIIQAGGEEALSQRMTATGLGFMQSSTGRGFGAAFFNPSAGAAGFDREGFMDAAGEGGLGMFELSGRIAQNLGSPSNVIKYEAYQDKFMSEMGKAFGGDMTIMQSMSAMASAKMLVSSGATDDITAAFRLSLMKQGSTPAAADAIIANAQNSQKNLTDNLAGVNQAKMQRTVDESEAVRGITPALGRMSRAVMQYVGDPLVVKPAEALIDYIGQGIVNFREERILGLERSDTRGLNYRAISRKPGEARGGADLTQRSEVLKSMDTLNLDKSLTMYGEGTGQVLSRTLKGVSTLLPELSVEEKYYAEGYTPSKGDVILNEETGIFNNWGQNVARATDIDRAVSGGREFAAKLAVAEKAIADGKDFSISSPQRSLVDRVASGEIRTAKMSLDDLSKQYFQGRGLGKLKDEELGWVVQQTEKLKAAGDSTYSNQFQEFKANLAEADKIASGHLTVGALQGATSAIVTTVDQMLDRSQAPGVGTNLSKNLSTQEKLALSTALARGPEGAAEAKKILAEGYSKSKGFFGGDAETDVISKAADQYKAMTQSAAYGRNVGVIKDKATIVATMMTYQGESQMKDVLASELASGRTGLKSDEVTAANEALAMIENTKGEILASGGLSKEQRSALRHTGVGKVMLKEVESKFELADGVEKSIKEEEASSKRKLDPSEKAKMYRDAFESNYKSDPAGLNTVVKAFTENTTEGRKAVYTAAVTMAQSETQAAGAGGTGTKESMGTAGGSGKDAADLQISNLFLIKNALEGIVAQLKK